MASNQFTPNQWGPARTSKSYEILMEGAECTSTPISLLGHGISDFSRELSDPVKIPVTVKKRGQIFTTLRTVRPAQITETTFKMAFPNTLWSPALVIARTGLNAETDMFAKYLCPADKQYEHAYIFPSVVLDPVEFVNAFVTSDTSEEAMDQTATGHISEERIQWAIGLGLLKDQTTSVTAVAFNYEDCVNANESVLQSMIAVGDAKTVYVSEDRFATQTAVTAAAFPTASVISSILSDGNTRIAGFRDVAAIATAATGGVAASFDGGLTWTLATGIAVPINAVAKFNNLYLAAGGTGAGAAKLYSSPDGLTWTDIVSSVLPATDALTSIAVDKDNSVFYLTAEAGKLLSGISTGASLLLSSLTANLPGTPSGALLASCVLAPNFLAVGGASGYYAETHDGGATWAQTFNGGSASIGAIAGNCFRTLIGVDAKVYERSVLTNMSFTNIVPQQGYTITGNVSAIEKAEDDDNYFLVGTAAGELLLAKPFYPNA